SQAEPAAGCGESSSSKAGPKLRSNFLPGQRAARVRAMFGQPSVQLFDLVFGQRRKIVGTKAVPQLADQVETLSGRPFQKLCYQLSPHCESSSSACFNLAHAVADKQPALTPPCPAPRARRAARRPIA